MKIFIEQTDERSLSGWATIIWRAVERNVRRLQERIYRATEDIGAQGLSRLPSNWHGRFSGEGAAATSPPYLTNCWECLFVAGCASQVEVESRCICWWGGVS